jgi:hypothetical protein
MSENDRIATLEQQVRQLTTALRAVVDLLDAMQQELGNNPMSSSTAHLAWWGDMRNIRALISNLPA